MFSRGNNEQNLSLVIEESLDSIKEYFDTLFEDEN